MIDRNLLFDMHRGLTSKALELMKLKNRDYGENDDPFRNFRRWGLLGILVRLGDKIARLETFVETGTLAVQSENVHDCILDIINYAVLFEGYHVDGKGSGAGNSQVAGPARPAKPQSWRRGEDSHAGDARGRAGGGTVISTTAPITFKNLVDVLAKGGIDSSRRRRKPVGSKSRSGGRKR